MPTSSKKSHAETLYGRPTSRKVVHRSLPIKNPPEALVQTAMNGLRNPLSQLPADRQSVDGRVGADAAAGAKIKGKKPTRP